MEWNSLLNANNLISEWFEVSFCHLNEILNGEITSMFIFLFIFLNDVEYFVYQAVLTNLHRDVVTVFDGHWGWDIWVSDARVY